MYLKILNKWCWQNKILIFIFCFISVQLNAQIQKIEEAQLVLKLPNTSWHFNKIERTNNEMVIYSFNRQIEDSSKIIVPILNVLIENANSDDKELFYAMYEYLQVNKVMHHVKIEEVFSLTNKGNKITPSKDAFGYKGISENANKTFYFLHLLNVSKEIQIIMECDSGDFSIYEKEFLEIIKSLQKMS